MKSVVCMMAMVILTAFSAAATPARIPAPRNGFWVIITSGQGPVRTTVQYFDLQLRLIHEEQIDGTKLDGNNKRTCRMLNKKLQLVLRR